MYLTDLPSDICNETGLPKTLITRRETIRLKHLQKTLFVYKLYSECGLLQRLHFMQFKGVMQYFEFLTNQLRGIYKITREFQFDNADKIVKQKHESFLDTLKMYKAANPIVVLDFDKTITNKRFHSLYKWLIMDEDVTVYINTANPSLETIEGYLEKHKLPMPTKIFNKKGKRQKVVNLKVLSIKNISRPLFYIDDEMEYIEYANLLFYQCYQYTRDGRILHRSLNIK